MKNEKFTIEFNKETGGISSIFLNQDSLKMNWIKKDHSMNTFFDFREKRYAHKNFELVFFIETKNYAKARFQTSDIYVDVEYSFNKEGNFIVTNKFVNFTDNEVFFLKGQVGLKICFNNDYCNASTCMTSRCSDHIWCGQDSSYVCLVKMGPSNIGLGLKSLKSGFIDYEQMQSNPLTTCDRGWFYLYPDIYLIKPKKSKILEYELFDFENENDFKNNLKNSKGFAYIEMEKQSIYQGEDLKFKVFAKVDKITIDGRPVGKSLIINNKEFIVKKKFKLGEHIIEIKYGSNRKTYSVFNVLLPFKQLIDNRVKFIFEKQQYNSKGSRLDGAFLIYDNEENRVYFDNIDPDLNASRERMAMGLFVAKYLQHFPNKKYIDKFMKYIDFILRENFDENTGEVFNTIGRYSEFKRLYNGPNMARLFLETYKVTKDIRFLKYILTILNFYYSNGGENFYPNGISMYEMLEAFKEANLDKEYTQLRNQFLIHIENIIKRGLNYPVHECTYEQTIVSPAVSFILDGYRITNDKRYLDEVKPHLVALERFDGFQPHYKLNSVAIRFWDAYWFGKYEEFGDTLPHQCSAISSMLYNRYGKLTNDQDYINKSINGLRNCLACFEPNGRAHASSIFPYRCNGKPGNTLDVFANDQDSILYLATDILLNE